MSDLILKPGAGDGLIYGPDGKTRVKALKEEPTTDRRELRRRQRRLCRKCGKNPHSRKLPNGLRVCLGCYYGANPRALAVSKAWMKLKKEGRLAPP